ncbi:MAG: hypothetical protein HOM52_05355 [Rhodospirillaceae bacterium]|jgi:putative DNA primase/helicase|nr:hypothetical protein [Rhodospirillaceae bacterium]MBT5037918.1 hypothetical protein [Rhodospirillaceae bacterium]
MTDAGAEMFSPLGRKQEIRSTRKDASSAKWAPIMPVPDDAPPPPERHTKLGIPANRYRYCNAVGALLGLVCRFEPERGGKEIRPLSFCRNIVDGTYSWRWKGLPALRSLYRLEELTRRPDAPVLICEGEKAVGAAALLLPDWVAITCAGGTGGVGKADWSPLSIRCVTIWPDADEAGIAFANNVARQAAKAGVAEVRIAMPADDLEQGWDAFDARTQGWGVGKALDFIEAANKIPVPNTSSRKLSHILSSNSVNQAPLREDLLDLVEDVELWHTPARDAYASLPIGGHIENWPVRSKTFRLWLCFRARIVLKFSPSGQALQDALTAIEATALFGSPEHRTHLRVARIDGHVYLDLCDSNWRAIEVRENGWRVIHGPPAKFIRSPAMRALPEPEAGESVDRLRGYVNVSSDDDFVLLVAWLVGTFRPEGPYPILRVNGEQGSAKSTLCRILRELIDPNQALVRSAPNGERELIVSAQNAHLLVLDNLSYMPPWLSDSLCRLSTGGGFSSRALYTDWTEAVFNGSRPIILNGIPDLAGRADLADRSLCLTLTSISEAERRTERELIQNFMEDRPYVLGALLDAVSSALRREKAARPLCFPRMSDFSAWVAAAEPGLGWIEGKFSRAYEANRTASIYDTIDADTVAAAVVGLIRIEHNWEGAPTTLHEVLGQHIPEEIRKGRAWPAPNKLKERLRRAQPALRSVGIHMDLEIRAPTRDRQRIYKIWSNREICSDE